MWNFDQRLLTHQLTFIYSHFTDVWALLNYVFVFVNFSKSIADLFNNT